MAKKTVKDLKDLAGTRVFVRVDYNVPVEGGKITDDTRIRASLPTLRYLIDAGARLVLASHLGRPKKGPAPEFSLAPVAARLAELLGRPVGFARDCVGDGVEDPGRGAGRRRACSCSRTCASTPRKRRTTPPSPSSSWSRAGPRSS